MYVSLNTLYLHYFYIIILYSSGDEKTESEDTDDTDLNEISIDTPETKEFLTQFFVKHLQRYKWKLISIDQRTALTSFGEATEWKCDIDKVYGNLQVFTVVAFQQDHPFMSYFYTEYVVDCADSKIG